MLFLDRTAPPGVHHLRSGGLHALWPVVRPLPAAVRLVAHLVAPIAGQLLVVPPPPVVRLTPTVGQLPGGTTLQNLTNGIGAWALILSLVGLVVGAALWALGAHSQNYQQSFVGRRAVLVSGVAALLIGAAPAIIGFFFNTGAAVH